MFIEERLLEKVAFGTQSGVEFNTLVTTLRSGAETRKAQWLRPLDRFQVVYRVLTDTDRRYVMNIFRVCRGRFAGFRLKDPLDYTATNEVVGVGDGSPSQTFQLRVSYKFGGVVEVREIYKPVQGRVRIMVAGDGVAADVDYTTGRFTLDGVPEGAEVTWTGEFDKPVRFDTDQLMWSLDDKAGAPEHRQRLTSTDLPITEYRVLVV